MQQAKASDWLILMLWVVAGYLMFAALDGLPGLPGLPVSRATLFLGAVVFGGLALGTVMLRRYEKRLNILQGASVPLPFAGLAIDPLTQLTNRVACLDRIESALARRQAGGDQLAVLIVDIDQFKQLNEIHGHRIGDMVLADTARRLIRFEADGTTIGRLGADEFVIIIESPALDDAPIRLARLVTEAVSAPIAIVQGQIRPSVTIGIATSEHESSSADAILRAAGVALFEAKREARGQIRMFDTSMEEALRLRSTLETDLRRALGAGEIVPFYQPLIALDDGRLTGFEVLARWQHPQHGLLPPSAFIPLAEQTGSVGDLFYQLLRAACFDAKDWPKGLGISLNVSPTQFAEPNMATRILSILGESGIAPERLELEITESAIVNEVSSARATLSVLREFGVAVALDDFGTGYSNLHHLSDLPIDRLKIDRVFVEKARNNVEDWKIVRAIVQFAHALNLETTAEGIEIPDVADILRDVGCDIGQGFFFGRPESAATTMTWLKGMTGGRSPLYPRLAP